VTSVQPVALITVEEMWRIQWKRETIGTLEETRCPPQGVASSQPGVNIRPLGYMANEHQKPITITPLLENTQHNTCTCEKMSERRQIDGTDHPPNPKQYINLEPCNVP